VIFRNKLIFYGEELLAPRPSPKLEDHTCRLSATACSIYSQLPSKTGGRLLHPQPEDAPCRGEKDPLNMGSSKITGLKLVNCDIACYTVECFVKARN
jgi:hypothetical protein